MRVAIPLGGVEDAERAKKGLARREEVVYPAGTVPNDIAGVAMREMWPAPAGIRRAPSQ